MNNPTMNVGGYPNPNQQPYGQPTLSVGGYPQQPGMMQPGMMQPGMMQPGMMQPMMPQPVFKQISIGQGIDMNEFNSIVQCATQAYLSKQVPLSTITANMIKQQLKGEWFVYVCEVGKKDYDFALTILKGGDFMSFSLDNKLFQICRLN